jgi:hypothetical protein
MTHLAVAAGCWVALAAALTGAWVLRVHHASGRPRLGGRSARPDRLGIRHPVLTGQ